MTIDTAAWKINDPEWQKMREEQWTVFEKWLTLYYNSDEDRSLSGSLLNARIFYDSGVLDKNMEVYGSSVGYEAAIVLHPSLTAESSRALIYFYDNHGKRNDLKGYFRHYFLARSRYLDLINAGVLSEDFMLALLEGAYGRSLGEAGEILGFDPKTKYLEVFRSVGDKLFLYFSNGENDTITYEIATYMLPFYLETLSKLTDDEARLCDLDFRGKLKTKKRVYDSGSVTDKKQLDFIKNLLDGIQSRLNFMEPYMREKMQQLFQ